MSDFSYQPLFEHGHDDTPYRSLGSDGVSTVTLDGEEYLRVAPEALTRLAAAALDDVSFLLRPGHLASLGRILDDPEASDNDRFVAMELLKNANIAAGRVLPSCQDTGTAIVIRPERRATCYTGADDADYLSPSGVWQNLHQKRNLRYSQLAPISTCTRKRTPAHEPARPDRPATRIPGHELINSCLWPRAAARANKTFLYQKTKALLNPAGIAEQVRTRTRSRTLGTSPPARPTTWPW